LLSELKPLASQKRCRIVARRDRAFKFARQISDARAKRHWQITFSTTGKKLWLSQPFVTLRVIHPTAAMSF
jgi:hypothetical protein